jgi:hypothetical protein
VEMSMSLDGRHRDHRVVAMTTALDARPPLRARVALACGDPGPSVARTFGTGLPSASPRGRIVRVFAAGFRQRVTPV